MKQGIIMEVNDRFLTLLTPDGEFLKARNQNNQYEIGQEISFVPVEKESFLSGFSRSFQRRTAGILVAASLLLLFTFLPSRVDNEVYAYMSIDGDSSIELAVNKDLQVIDVVAYNDSGKEVIAGIEWENEAVEKVSAQILSSLEEPQEIVVGTAYASPQEKKPDSKLNQVIDSLEEETEIEIESVQATADERKAAKEKGVSVGSYKAQQARERVKEKKENQNKEIHGEEQDIKVEPTTPNEPTTNNNQSITTPPVTNNNGNGNGNGNENSNTGGNKNPGKSNNNGQNNSNAGQQTYSNPGQQKKTMNQPMKKSEKAESKQLKQQQVHGNKEQKPRN